ncbi:MAG: SUMF1/EgtB/PvdO family nonheme iron enzyme [Pirellulales bacterium]
MRKSPPLTIQISSALMALAIHVLGQAPWALVQGQTPSTSPEVAPGRNITVDRGTLFEPVAGRASQGNAGLFIGVNDFVRDKTLANLQFAVHDAIEQAYLFAFELKLIPPQNCILMLSGKPLSPLVQEHLDSLRNAGATVTAADRTEILVQLERVRQIGQKPTDLLVCAVSSHGFIDGQAPYVMPSDGLKNRLQLTAVPIETIELDMDKSQAGHRLLFVDACQERINARSAGGQPLPGQGMDAAFREAFAKPTGQYKLASCSPKELSYENSKLGGVGHGLFTHALLEALRGGAAADKQSFVRLSAVEEYVSTFVTKWSTDAQLAPQTPFSAGARGSRTLPLAKKAGDLATLAASLRRRPTGGDFTEELRASLAELLGKLDQNLAADRELVAEIRNFLNDPFKSNALIPYFRQELEKRKTPPPSPSRVGMVLENSVGMKFAYVPPGEFLFGSRNEDRQEEDLKQARVRIAQGFYLGVFEVTQREYQRVTGENPSYFSPTGAGRNVVAGKATDLWPADSVSREMADQFCRKLSEVEEERKAGRIYRLPQEQEWEYACRAGTTSRFHCGERLTAEDAHFSRQGVASTSPVGTRKPNPWGLHDMHGNVQEWCVDRDTFVLRGGSWRGGAEECRSASRFVPDPPKRAVTDGFRVLCEVQAQAP